MALKDTVRKMKASLEEICENLPKAEEGNKAASKRVRLSSLHFAKVAKIYRKESVAAEKKGGTPKKKKAARPAKKRK